MAELVHDHLGVGGSVDVADRLEPVDVGEAGAGEMPAQLGPGAQGSVAERGERVPRHLERPTDGARALADDGDPGGASA